MPCTSCGDTTLAGVADGVRTEDLLIYQGSDFERHWPILDGANVQYGPGELAGWTARGMIRAVGGSLLYTWPPEGLEVDAAQARLWVRIPAAVSSAWPVALRDWVTRPRYDVELLGPGDDPVLRRLMGRVSVSPEQTQE